MGSFPPKSVKLTKSQQAHVRGCGRKMKEKSSVTTDMPTIPVYNDFAGTEAIMVALDELRNDSRHAGSCDIAKGPVKWIHRNFELETFHVDCFSRNFKTEPLPCGVGQCGKLPSGPTNEQAVMP